MMMIFAKSRGLENDLDVTGLIRSCNGKRKSLGAVLFNENFTRLERLRLFELAVKDRINLVRDISVLAGAVRHRERNRKLIPGRDETRRVGLNDKLRGDFELAGCCADRAFRISYRRNANLAREFREIERNGGLAVLDRDALLPNAERLEAARTYGTYAP